MFGDESISFDDTCGSAQDALVDGICGELSD